MDLSIKLKKLYNKNRLITTFLLRGVSIYLLWWLFYDYDLVNLGFIDSFLIDNLIETTNFILSNMGYDTFQAGNFFGIQNTSGVLIGAPCNAFSLMVLYGGFILSFPGKSKKKWWIIPTGILIIHLLNILRVMALVLLALYSPASLEFNHSYTFTLIVYSSIFIMWMYWVKQYTRKT